MAKQQLVTYAIIRCNDERRDEAVNVGVVVLDPSVPHAEVRIANDLSRVTRMLPELKAPALRDHLNALPGYFAGIVRELTPARLGELAAEWSNTVRLSSVRSIAHPNVTQAADELFHRYVAAPHTAENASDVRGAEAFAATSKRVAKVVRSRLVKRGFEERRDFDVDARVTGKTRNQTEVPVWFPLRVKHSLLIDSMEIVGNERRTVDSARLIAAKSDEVLRANGYHVTVVVRPGEDDRLNELTQTLIMEEGSVSGRTPEVVWQKDVDDFVSRIGPPQYRLVGA